MPNFADALPGANHPDAALLRLGAELDRWYATYIDLLTQADRAGDVFEAALDEATRARGDHVPPAEMFRIRMETGMESAAKKFLEGAERPIAKVETAITNTPARTYAGLAVKLRAFAFSGGFFEDLEDPHEDVDWPIVAFRSLMQNVQALADAERAG